MTHPKSTSLPEELFFIDPFMQSLCQELGLKIKKSFSVMPSIYEIAQNLSSPPKEEWGHYSLPCFFLSKKLKKKPTVLASQIALSAIPSFVFEKASAEGPYVNFFIKKDFIIKQLLGFLNQTGFARKAGNRSATSKVFSSYKVDRTHENHVLGLDRGSNKISVNPISTPPLTDTGKGALAFFPPSKKTAPWLIEYSQPNTHKDLHIGHLRNLFFGLSLTTLLKKRGWPVITCTYPGDRGAHINKCLWYLIYHNKEQVPKNNKGAWLGSLYAKACQKYDQVPEEERKPQIADISRQLQNKKGPSYKLWKETKLWSKALMEQLYQWAGAQFDHWYWESEIDNSSVKWVKQLHQENYLQLSQGAIGLDLGPDLGFCLLLKTDGQGLYATKDLYLIAQKFKELKPGRNIYIVDQRQETHFRQIFKVMEHIGHKEWANKSFHLKYNFVELSQKTEGMALPLEDEDSSGELSRNLEGRPDKKSVVISSRTGHIVPAMTLIHKMTYYIEDTFLKKYKGVWSEKKIKHTANKIAEVALKFGMNDQDLNKKIVFDMQEWLKLDGRSGPYIQYAHARADTLLKKIKPVKLEGPLKPLITTREEWRLILHISWFSLLVEKSAWEMKTAPICHYLFELAQNFSRFYQNCPIGGAESAEQKNFRLFLVQVSKKTLSEGLSLLSIPALDEM